jgi:hypothetical protein
MIFERAGFILAAAVIAFSAASRAFEVVVLELSFDMKRSRITTVFRSASTSSVIVT